MHKPGRLSSRLATLLIAGSLAGCTPPSSTNSNDNYYRPPLNQNGNANDNDWWNANGNSSTNDHDWWNSNDNHSAPSTPWYDRPIENLQPTDFARELEREIERACNSLIEEDAQNRWYSFEPLGRKAASGLDGVYRLIEGYDILVSEDDHTFDYEANSLDLVLSGQTSQSIKMTFKPGSDHQTTMKALTAGRGGSLEEFKLYALHHDEGCDRTSAFLMSGYVHTEGSASSYPHQPGDIIMRYIEVDLEAGIDHHECLQSIHAGFMRFEKVSD